jgi:hypothetical protein
MEIVVMEKQQKNKPVKTLRVGKLCGAIWQNETKAGTQYRVTFSRLYKNEKGKWADSTSFNRQDLLGIALVAVKAFSALHEGLSDSSERDEQDVTE